MNYVATKCCFHRNKHIEHVIWFGLVGLVQGSKTAAWGQDGLGGLVEIKQRLASKDLKVFGAEKVHKLTNGHIGRNEIAQAETCSCACGQTIQKDLVQ